MLPRAASSCDALRRYGVVYGGSGRLLGMQVLGALAVIVWSCCTMLPFFVLLMVRTGACTCTRTCTRKRGVSKHAHTCGSSAFRM